MSERTMLQLGDYKFEIATAAYQQLEAKDAAKWAEQARIGREPALQWVGQEASTITLNGVVYPAFNGSMAAGIDPLLAMMREGTPYHMVAGTGSVLGQWALLDVTTTRSYFLDDGRARKIEFTLSLKSYGPDEGDAGQAPHLAAVAQRTETPSPLAAIAPERATDAAKSSSSAVEAALASLDAATSAIAELPDITEDSPLSRLSDMASAVSGAVSTVTGMVDSIKAEVAGVVDDVVQGARDMIPQGVTGALRTMSAVTGEIVDMAGGVLDAVSAVTALPSSLLSKVAPDQLRPLAGTLMADLNHLKAVTDLHGFGLDVSLKDLRSTERTFDAVADLVGGEGAGAARRMVADLSGRAADCAEELRAVCAATSTWTTAAVEKFKLNGANGKEEAA